MPQPPPQALVAADRFPGWMSVAFWVTAVAVYAAVGMLLPPAAFLGFWQSIPYVVLMHWLRPRVLGALAGGRAA